MLLLNLPYPDLIQTKLIIQALTQYYIFRKMLRQSLKKKCKNDRIPFIGVHNLDWYFVFHFCCFGVKNNSWHKKKRLINLKYGSCIVNKIYKTTLWNVQLDLRCTFGRNCAVSVDVSQSIFVISSLLYRKV